MRDREAIRSIGMRSVSGRTGPWVNAQLRLRVFDMLLLRATRLIKVLSKIGVLPRMRFKEARALDLPFVDVGSLLIVHLSSLRQQRSGVMASFLRKIHLDRERVSAWSRPRATVTIARFVRQR